MPDLLTRRRFLQGGAAALAHTTIAACAHIRGTTGTPTRTQVAVTAAAKAVDAPIELRYMERAGIWGDHMRYASRLFEERHPNVIVNNEPAGWSDLSAKVPAMVASNTMADVACQHGTYMLPALGKQGAWLNPLPLVEQDAQSLDIYYPWALDACRLGPNDELVALPMTADLGQNELHWNVELLDDLGIDAPHSRMSKPELLVMWRAIQTKLPEGSFATDIGAAAHAGIECHARSFGGHVIGPERRRCGLNLPETQDAYRWAYALQNDFAVMPRPDDMPNGSRAMFYDGTLATWMTTSGNVWVGFSQAVAGRFTLGHCTWPHAEGEGWGTVPTCDTTVISAKTKHPDAAWGLARLLASYEVSRWAALHPPHLPPGAVIQAWNDPAVWEACPPYKDCAQAWAVLDPDQCGAIAVPYNARRQEFVDWHDAEWKRMLYGEMSFSGTHVAKLQDALQAIMDKPDL